MKITKIAAILMFGGLAACETGGDLDIAGLKYNSLNGNFSVLPLTVAGAVPTTGSAIYSGGYSGVVNNGPAAQGGATLAADFTAATANLNLVGPALTTSVSGKISGTSIVPTAGAGILTGQFYNPTGEVVAGRFETSNATTHAKGQFIVERLTDCPGGVCP